MRIAYLVWQIPVLSEAFILNQITGLVDRGHEVDIYAIADRPKKTFKVHPDVEKYRLVDHTCQIPKIPANYFLRTLKVLGLLALGGYRRPRVWLRSLNVSKYGENSASLRLLYRTLPFLGKRPYDIIDCQYGPLGLQGMTLRNIGALKGRLITSIRGYGVTKYVRQHGDHVYKDLFAAGDLFLPVCDYFRRRLISLGCDEEKVFVHRAGIDCRKFAFAPRRPSPDGQVRIVTIGRLIEKKGIKYAIRAFAKLTKTNPNLRYTIIGDGPLREDLQGLVQQFQVSNQVIFVGEKYQQEIVEILNQSHILMAPSVTAADGNQEGIPNTLKEAMARGLPVISTFHSGIPELVKDGVSGFLVPERDPEALAMKLSHLIENPQIWLRMGQAGRSYVEQHYDSEKINNELVEIYQSLLR